MLLGISRIGSHLKTIRGTSGDTTTRGVAETIMRSKIGRIQWVIIPRKFIPAFVLPHPNGPRSHGISLTNTAAFIDLRELLLEAQNPLLPIFLETRFWLVFRPLPNPHYLLPGFKLQLHFTPN